MSELDLTAQFVREYRRLEDRAAALEREHQRLLAEPKPVPVVDPAEVRALTGQRDDLKRRLAEAQQQTEAELLQRAEELGHRAATIARLEEQLVALRTTPPPPPPDGDLREIARLRERVAVVERRLRDSNQKLVLVEFQLAEALADVRKFYEENDRLRQQLHEDDRRQYGVER